MKTQELITKEDVKLVARDESQTKKALNIKTDNDVESAAEVLIHLKREVDSAEAKRKSYVQPAQETIKRINDDFKKIIVPRQDFITQLKDKVVEYVSMRKKELKSKEKELQKEMGDRSLVLDNGLDKVVCATGELRFRKGVTVKVTNKNALPEKYWVIDMKAIETDALEGDEDIPGVKVTVEPISSVAIYGDKE